MLFTTLAYAMGQAPSGGGSQGNPLMAFMPLILLFVIFYFLLIRPQQKRAKEHREMLSNLKKGDYVITGGGLYGRVVDIDGDVITLCVAPDVEVKVNRNFISSTTQTKVVEENPKKKK